MHEIIASLDGYIAGPNGELDWHLVDDEVHRHFNDVLRGQHRAHQIGLWRGVNLVKVTLVGRLCQELPDALVQGRVNNAFCSAAMARAMWSRSAPDSPAR